MIVEFVDSVAGTPVYINPEYVVVFRPDPGDPTKVTMVKLRDGESGNSNELDGLPGDDLHRPITATITGQFRGVTE